MKKSIGIDIGTYSIKIVELEAKKNGLELTRCVSELVKGNDVKATLQGLLQQEKLLSKRVNVSLSGASVIVRYVDMPPHEKG